MYRYRSGKPDKHSINELFADYPVIEGVVDQIYKQGGRAFLVGGAVRDMVLGLAVHDLDIEVHNLSMDQLAAILRQKGTVSVVGKSFGVLKLYGTPIDWSLPRSDSAGRKPEVSIDPHMSITDALRRRDLTMNAMALELHSGEFFDPFQGLQDIQERVLRSPDLSFFKEDPLRLYRVMQFSGRFEMHPDQALHEICSTMDISQVSQERKEAEFEKLLLYSRRPSIGIRWLSSIGRLSEIALELSMTQTVHQNPAWHPEGTVFEHLMQAVDAGVLSPVTGDEKLILLYAALCHDLGKISTTIMKDGVLRSPGHAQEGVFYARSLLKRITQKTKIIRTVLLLVRYHMEPSHFISAGAQLSAYRRLALKLSPYTNLQMLAFLATADSRGRNPVGGIPLEAMPDFIPLFLHRAEQAQSLVTATMQILHGRDINDLVNPGPLMGQLLQYVYEIQLNEGITDKKLLRDLVIEKLKK
ncbi:CCA tRNA nucleotidyltransferase [Candidatus Dependentiae bacterium]|nr:CCA tRNA nucleotidyltransferase [Candidatus Dependentiae bacterium]